MTAIHDAFQVADTNARRVYGYRLNCQDGGEAWAHRLAYAGYCRLIAQGLRQANAPKWLVNRWIESSRNALKSAREYRKFFEPITKSP